MAYWVKDFGSFQMVFAVTNRTDFIEFATNGADTEPPCFWMDRYTSYMKKDHCPFLPWEEDQDCKAFLIYSEAMNEVERNYQMLQIAFASLKR